MIAGLVKKAGKKAVQEALKQAGYHKSLETLTAESLAGIEEELEMIRRLMALELKITLSSSPEFPDKKKALEWINQFLEEDDD